MASEKCIINKLRIHRIIYLSKINKIKFGTISMMMDFIQSLKIIKINNLLDFHHRGSSLSIKEIVVFIIMD